MNSIDSSCHHESSSLSMYNPVNNRLMIDVNHMMNPQQKEYFRFISIKNKHKQQIREKSGTRKKTIENHINHINQFIQLWKQRKKICNNKSKNTKWSAAKKNYVYGDR
ncbi:hypothetical protein DERF_000086 [Dermatophagoides farinae]|uniref:Uncharacterized protein n=1 Tax=Dermatophagoides farinae TaxID=6954 RepID=A0A922IC31_DERFA|nr:hypothetical protein DERF_000086 [Dermatophagoides farinae]